MVGAGAMLARAATGGARSICLVDGGDCDVAVDQPEPGRTAIADGGERERAQSHRCRRQVLYRQHRRSGAVRARPRPSRDHRRRQKAIRQPRLRLQHELLDRGRGAALDADHRGRRRRSFRRRALRLQRLGSQRARAQGRIAVSPRARRAGAHAFIARRLSWHGATLGVLGVSHHRSRRSYYEAALAPASSCLGAAALPPARGRRTGGAGGVLRRRARAGDPAGRPGARRRL